MTAAETMTGRVDREMRERAARGEPEPGIYLCARCGRDDCRMYTVVDAPTEVNALRNHGLLNRMDQSMRTLPGADMHGELLCPCCSFPHLSGCTHPRKQSCSRCGLPMEPAGSLPGGGPFVRCDGPQSHPPREAVAS